jgi:hypothetical protein
MSFLLTMHSKDGKSTRLKMDTLTILMHLLESQYGRNQLITTHQAVRDLLLLYDSYREFIFQWIESLIFISMPAVQQPKAELTAEGDGMCNTCINVLNRLNSVHWIAV